MNEKIKAIETEATEVIETTEENKESKIKELGSKVKDGLKKNSKKIAATAVIGIVGVLAYALGASSKITDEEYDDDVIDGEAVEADSNDNSEE